MKKTISFTTILHDKRKKLGLSLMEYCVADTIYNLSNNPKAPVPGWCIASKDTIALILDTTRITIFSCVKKLIEINVVEKHTETKHLRTTQKWFSNIIIGEEDIEEEEEKPKTGKVKPYFRGSFCRKDNFTGKWKVKENGSWLELADGYEKEIQWKD